MKKLMYLTAVSLMAVAGLTSCSDDDTPKWENPIPSGVYTDADGLTLTVNGAPVVGKTVQFERSANDDSKGRITISSTFNFGSIPDVPGALASTVLECPGVLPGSPVTVLNVDLTEVRGAAATFVGKGESEYCTYEYNGTVTDKSIDLNFTGVTLKNQALAGTYKLLPYNMNEDSTSDEYGTVYSEPIYVNWESSAEFNLFGTPMPISNLVRLLMVMPVLENNMRVPDMLCTLLQDVTFDTAGNIIATYADLDSEGATPAYLKSAPNMAQYVVTGGNSLRFFLNPQAVMRESTRVSSPIDINNLLGNVLAQLAPMMKDGVPMYYKVNGNDTTIYLNTETLLPLLKQNVLPLLRNQTLIDTLVELVKQDEDMGFIAAMLPDIITSLGDVIENTTTLEIGLNLTTAIN